MGPLMQKPVSGKQRSPFWAYDGFIASNASMKSAKHVMEMRAVRVCFTPSFEVTVGLLPVHRTLMVNAILVVETLHATSLPPHQFVVFVVFVVPVRTLPTEFHMLSVSSLPSHSR
jgi:hypothetical protein